jgi:hypothetical protein
MTAGEFYLHRLRKSESFLADNATLGERVQNYGAPQAGCR